MNTNDKPTYLYKWGGYDMTTKPEDRLKKIELSKLNAKCTSDRLDYKPYTGQDLIVTSVKAEKKLTDEEMEIIRAKNREKRERLLLEKAKNPEVIIKKPATMDDFCVALKQELSARNIVTESMFVEIIKEEVSLSEWGRIKLEARNWLRHQVSKLIVMLQKI